MTRHLGSSVELGQQFAQACDEGAHLVSVEFDRISESGDSFQMKSSVDPCSNFTVRKRDGLCVVGRAVLRHRVGPTYQV